MSKIPSEPALAGRMACGQAASNGSAMRIVSRIQRKLHKSGLPHLSVVLVSEAEADPVRAEVLDPNGVVVLSVSVDRTTGDVRDVF